MSTKFSQMPPSIDHGVRTERKSELSLTQEQIWVFEQITPGTAVYNIPLALHFKGHLDVEVLERSLMEIVRRHEVLRASFRAVEGRPVQVVGVVSTVILSRIDVPEGNGADRLENVKQACEAECCRPFDLVHGVPIRFTLFRLSPVEQVLLITVHHIVFDGWSEGHFLTGIGSNLRCLLERISFPPFTSLDPVFRLCSRPTAEAAGQGLGEPRLLLAKKTGGHPSPAGPAPRPPNSNFKEPQAELDIRSCLVES